MTFDLKSTFAAGLILAMVATSAIAASTDSGSDSSPDNTPVIQQTGDLTEARALIDAGRYKGAFSVLAKLANGAGKSDPDVWNLLGFTSRKLKHWDDAGKYYEAALRLKPGHIGALEYQGELFIQTGDLDKAKANLAKLTSLCGTCEEAQDLAAALAKAGA